MATDGSTGPCRGTAAIAAQPAYEAALDTPLYSSRITNTYLKLLGTRYPQVDLGELLRYAGMELREIEDEGHWFTQRQVNRFQLKLRELTGSEGIAREAGLYSASPEAIGGIGRYILGLVSPGRAYALASRFVPKFSRSCCVASRLIGATSAEIVITPKPGVREERFQCENRQGYLESVARHFNARLQRLEHPECIFNGDPHCRYVITWQPSRSSRWRRAGLAALALTLGSLVAAAAGALPWAVLHVLLPVAAVAVLLVNAVALHLDNRELRAAVAHLEHSSDELAEQINRNYEHALMINEIGQSLGKERTIKGILDSVVAVLGRRLEYDRGAILIADPGGSPPVVVAGFGYRPEQLVDLAGEAGCGLERQDPHGLFGRCFHERQSFIVNDLATAAAEVSRSSLEFAGRLGAKSLVCCPIVYENESLGLLLVDNVTTKRPLLQRDVNLLSGIAPEIALGIRTIRLAESSLEQIRSHNAELEQRVGARTAALEDANRELESFSYSVSHDLRAPLRAIDGFSRILIEEYGPGLDGEARRLLGVVSANAQRMARLIDDLLTFSRLGRANLHAGSVDMAALVAGVLEELCPPPARGRVRLTVGALPSCGGDGALLRQVWVNLIGNALKFSSKRERAEIVIVGEQHGDEIVYHVRDNGVGFDMAYVDKLFGVFQRLHGPEQFEGTGVGLAIVQRIVRRHGGRVWADGTPGGGASFGFTLPVGRADGRG